MEKVEIDYEGLRNTFESTGNRAQLDKLVLTFIGKLELKMFREGKPPYIPFLKGVELQKETIDQLSIIDTYVLILQDAKPRDLLIAHIFQIENALQKFYELDWHGIVDIKVFYEHIFRGMPLSKRVDFLYENEKYLMLFNEAKKTICTLEYFGYENFETFKNAVTEFIEFIVRNGYPHIAFAMSIISELYERRLEIVNGWIKQEKALELDIYALPFIEGAISEALDKLYTEELQKRCSTLPNNDLKIAPVSNVSEGKPNI